MYCQEYLIYHDHCSKHLVPYLEQRHKVGHMNLYNQMNSCHYYVDSYNPIYENSYIIWIHALLAQFPICGCNYFFTFGAVNVADSHVCLWTCTDARQVLQRRSVCSSPALLAAPLSNGGSRCQDSWIAVSDMHEFMYQHECRLFAMQGQRISWSPMLDNLVTASGSPGFTFWNLLLQGHYRQGIAFRQLCFIW